MRRKPKSTLVLLLPTLCLAQLLLGQAKQKAEPYAVVAGTVFRDPGFAQPGASRGTGAQKRACKETAASDQLAPQGAVRFRVPAGPNRFVVTATLKGFQTAREEFEIQGQEQINATLLLVPESKQRGGNPSYNAFRALAFHG